MKQNLICLVFAGILILSSSSVVVGEKTISFTQEHAGSFDFLGPSHNNSEHMLGFEFFEVFDVDRDGSDDIILDSISEIKKRAIITRMNLSNL